MSQFQFPYPWFSSAHTVYAYRNSSQHPAQSTNFTFQVILQLPFSGTADTLADTATQYSWLMSNLIVPADLKLTATLVL